MEMLGTQTDSSLGWIMNYLSYFAAQLPLEPGLLAPIPNSLDSSADSERMKRRPGDIEKLKVELRKWPAYPPIGPVCEGSFMLPSPKGEGKGCVGRAQLASSNPLA